MNEVDHERVMQIPRDLRDLSTGGFMVEGVWWWQTDQTDGQLYPTNAGTQFEASGVRGHDNLEDIRWHPI